MVQKRFPLGSFLNDKSVDGELYAIFQLYSKPIDGKTVVKKEELPKQKELCGKLGFRTPKTYRAHFNYLVEAGYIEVLENGDYWLKDIEDSYILLSLQVLATMYIEGFQKNEVKVFVYLAQRFKFIRSLKRKEYSFSYQELGKALNVTVRSYQAAYEHFFSVLQLLKKLELIEVDVRDNFFYLTFVNFFDG